MVRNKKLFVKILAFVLAVAILVPGIGVSAASGNAAGTTGSSSSSTLADLLSAVKYDEYYDKYSAVAKDATQTVKLEGEAILSYLESATNAFDIIVKDENGNDVLDKDGNPMKKYVATEADIVDKDKQIAIVQTVEGEKCIFLPAEGTVAWKIDVPETALYSIDMRYYAYQGEGAKTTGIERTFFINGKVPFYEARFLTLTKTWVDDETTYNKDENGNIIYITDSEGNKVPQFQTDINGNEIKPSKKQDSEWSTYTFWDSTGYHSEALKFYFEQGENVISLEAQREAMYVSSITLYPNEGLRDYNGQGSSYEAYIKYYEGLGAKDYTGAPIKIQGEYPSATSENTIYATNDRSSSITDPQHASKLYLNTIGGEGGEKWLTIGQWVRYKVEVPESGFYTVVLRFKQSVLAGTFSSRTIRVKLPGEAEATVPFTEAYYLQFNYGDDWQKKAITDGSQTLKIYLEKGVNEIEFEACFGNMTEILKDVSESLATINDIYIKLLSITGATPDANRDYGFYDIMPDDVDELGRQSEKLYELADRFEEIVGTSGSHSKTLETVARLLEKMSNSDKIARNMANLKENLGTLGTWLQNSMQQPLQIDTITFQNPSDPAGKATDNFLQLLWYEIRQFFASFTADYNTLGAVEEVDDENVVEVWTTLGRDQAQIIRNLITNDFNSQYEGKSVELKLVAGGALLPSVLAGVGPDISLGHGSGDVINWAIRSAVVGLDQFEGYDEVATWFSESAMIPLTLQELYHSEDYVKKHAEEYEAAYRLTEEDIAKYDAYVKAGGTESLAAYAYDIAREHNATTVVFNDVDRVSQLEREYAYTETVYGLPETQSFAMMFYRADVLVDLGIQPPKTWEELIAIIPELQNNHMEIALPTQLGGLNTFLYQMKGELYEDDGRRIGLDTDEALSAFDYLCQFFQQYSFPVSYSFVNRFRSGEMPIGILDYTTYTQLSVYATEIKGLWEFVPLPAYVETDAKTGEITYSNNTSVSGVSADIMLRNKDRSEELTEFAWNFMKWFVSEKNQIEYANELTALLGSVSKHNTANINALESLPWTTNEYKNLMSQFNNLTAIEEHPGGYIIGRYVGFAFLAVVNNNADAEDSMLEYIVDINKELTRKRKEFGLAYYEITYSTSFTEEKE